MINRYMARLSDELRAEDVPDPLRERVLLAAVWDDLCRLAGETPPPHVRLVLEDLANVGLPAADAIPDPVSNAVAGSQRDAAPAPEEVGDDEGR